MATNKKPRTKKIKDETPIEGPIDLSAPSTQEEPKLPAQGLGDTIKSITNALGIETCAKCEERRKQLNKIFPWLNAKNMPRLDEKDTELMRRVIKTPNQVINDDVNGIFELYNRIYQPRPQIKRCNCPGLLGQMVERLTLLMEED